MRIDVNDGNLVWFFYRGGLQHFHKYICALDYEESLVEQYVVLRTSPVGCGTCRTSLFSTAIKSRHSIGPSFANYLIVLW